jgi:cobalt-zinc-cadmium efflux system protein
MGGSIYIVSEAVPRLFSAEQVHTGGMLALAVLGVLINGAAVLRLKGGSKIHERVVMLHLLEDVFGWIAVLIVSIVIRVTGLYFLDPLLSMCIALYVLIKVFSKLVQSMRIFLQSVPEHIEAERIGDMIKEVGEVVDVHDIHVWSLDGEYNVGTVHVVVKNGTSTQKRRSIKEEIRKQLIDLDIQHTTIEIESEDEVCGYKYC